MTAPSPALLPVGRPRDPTVDVLRGLALVGVLTIHLAARIPAADPLFAAGRLVDHLGRFGVPVFLGVFGWGLGRAASVGPIGPAWVLGRLRAVGPAYLAWAFLYAAVAPVDGAGHWLWDPRLDWPTRLALTLFGYGAEQLYYMTAYFGLLLIAPVVGAAFSAVGGRTALALAALGLAANTVVLGVVEAAVRAGGPPSGLAAFLLHTEARTPLHWFGFFVGGAGIGRYLAVGGQLPTPRVWWLPVGLTLHFWVALRPPAARFDDFWASPALVAGALAPLVWGPVLCGRIAPTRFGHWLGRFGADSLPTYLGHVLWLRLGWWLANSWPTSPRLLMALATMATGNWLYGRIHPWVFGRSTRPAVSLTGP